MPRLQDAAGIEEGSQPIHWLEAQRPEERPRAVRYATKHRVSYLTARKGGGASRPVPAVETAGYLLRCLTASNSQFLIPKKFCHFGIYAYLCIVNNRKLIVLID